MERIEFKKAPLTKKQRTTNNILSITSIVLLLLVVQSVYSFYKAIKTSRQLIKEETILQEQLENEKDKMKKCMDEDWRVENDDVIKSGWCDDYYF